MIFQRIQRTQRTITMATLLMLAAAAAAQDASQDVVETLDGRSLTGEVTRLGEKALAVKTNEGEQLLPRKDLAEIIFKRGGETAGGDRANVVDTVNAPGRMVVRTMADGWVACKALSLADGKLQLDTPLLGETTADLKSARAIFLPANGQTPQQVIAECERYRIKPGSRDVLAIERPDGKWVGAEVVLLGITDKKVAFRYRDNDRTVNRDSVRAIWLAELAAERPQPAGVLVGREGCRLHFSTITLTADAAATETFFAGKVSIPRDQLASIRFFSDRLVSLADLEPTAVKEYGTLDVTFPYRRNRAVGGGPIRLDGRTYRRGLGLHSFCELTYTLDGKYSAFIATVGIDDAARPAGLATLTVLGDGKALAIETADADDEPRNTLELSGKASAKPIRVDVRGVKTLVIRVGFGSDDLDVGDHVDLAAARLVK